MKVEDMMILGAFLAWAEKDNPLYGGIHADQALDAACRIMGLPRDQFAAIMRGELKEAPDP